MIAKIKAMSLEAWIAVCLTIAMCIVRLAIAASNVFFVLALILLIVKLFKDHKQGGISVSSSYKQILLVIAICAVAILPAVLTSPHVLFSARQWLEIFIYRITPLFAFAFAIKNSTYCKRMLFAFFIFFSADCLTAVYQVAAGIESRGSGFNLNSLHLAGNVSMVIPILLIGVLEKRFGTKARLVMAIFLLCAVLGLGAGFSRGACLTVGFLTVCIMMVYAFKHPKYLFVFIVMVAGVGVFLHFHPQVMQRLLSSGSVTNVSNVARFYMIRGCIAIFKDNPLFGCGFGNFAEFYKEMYIYKGTTAFLHAHNNYFQLLAETGLVGFIGFMVYNFSVVWINAKTWVQQNSPYRMMVVCGWLGFLMFGFAEYTFDHGDINKIWWFLLGAILLLDEADKESC